MMDNKSEYLRMKQQIDDEYVAMERALRGMAITARHDFITKRMECIAGKIKALVEVAGDEVARELLLGPARPEGEEVAQ